MCPPGNVPVKNLCVRKNIASVIMQGLNAQKIASAVTAIMASQT